MMKPSAYGADYSWNGKGYALSNLRKFEQAIECYDKALDLNSKYADAWDGKGYALSRTGKIEDAIVCYDKP
jgi:tetratricopeptide (TPR) repeat protein